MINIIGIGHNRLDMTLGALKAITTSDVIIGYADDLEKIQDLIKSCEIIEITDLFEDSKKAVLKSRNGKTVSLISSLDYYKIASALFFESVKYKNIKINIIPGVSAAAYVVSTIGAPLGDYAQISLDNSYIPTEEIKSKLTYALKANLILIVTDISKDSFDMFKELVLELKGENCFIGVNNGQILRIKNLTFDKLPEDAILLAGNDLTYKKGGKLITPSNFPINSEIHELSLNHFKKFINGEVKTGPNKDCEYYPCHYEGQCCDFCYCPFYPCGDSSTGGYWIKNKNIWSCENCLWLHDKNTVKCLRPPLEELIEDENDLKDKKQLLLKLRRMCLLGYDSYL